MASRSTLRDRYLRKREARMRRRRLWLRRLGRAAATVDHRSPDRFPRADHGRGPVAPARHPGQRPESRRSPASSSTRSPPMTRAPSMHSRCAPTSRSGRAASAPTTPASIRRSTSARSSVAATPSTRTASMWCGRDGSEDTLSWRVVTSGGQVGLHPSPEPDRSRMSADDRDPRAGPDGDVESTRTGRRRRTVDPSPIADR